LKHPVLTEFRISMAKVAFKKEKEEKEKKKKRCTSKLD
jgi:hypothetical protein